MLMRSMDYFAAFRLLICLWAVCASGLTFAEPWHRIVVTEFGNADVLQWESQEQIPEPGPGEVRLRVLTASASFTDVMIRKGLYAGLGDEPPFVPGYDLIGEVEAIGTDVTGLKIGQRVADLTVWGSYTQFAIRPATHLVPVPDGVDPIEAVALILSYTTAYQMLHRTVDIEPGETIVVHGASGAVGTALTQLAVLHGVNVLGTASAAKLDYVSGLGAEPIDYRSQDFVEVVAEKTAGKGVAAVFDAVGVDNFKRSYQSLSEDGYLVVYGMYTTSLQADAGDMLSMAAEFLSYQWQLLKWKWFGDEGKRVDFYSITQMRDDHPDWFQQDVGVLMALLLNQKLKPTISQVLPLKDAAKAHRLIEAGGVRGKLVLKVAD